ncbi:MAG: glycosyltransferase [Gemmatimonadales bacterium]
MRIGIAAVGSRGDVQPYLALGQGLRRAGHDVRIIVDRTFTDLVRGAGLEISPVAADPAGALADNLAGVGDSPIHLLGWMRRHLRPMVRGYFADVRDASEGLDVLLYSVLNLAAQHLAELGRIQGLAAYLQPVTPTRAFPHPLVPHLPGWLPWRGSVNRLGFGVTGRVLYLVMRRLIDEARRDVLNLGPLPRGYYRSLETLRAPILYGYSAHVLPKPADWGDHLHVTGYWFVEADTGWAPPRELQEFLDAGPPPVYVGFGSMGGSDTDDSSRLVTEALARAGARGILLGARGAAVTRLSDTVVAISGAPHDWLFPRCSAVAHHGGAGTTAAGLRAGVPAVTVPFFADQFFWGWRLFDLGVAAPPIRRRKLTAARLAESIRTVTRDERIPAAALSLGGRIRSEDGVGNAVRLIERLVG